MTSILDLCMQGKRHIIPMEGDVGTCELPLHVRLHTENVTWLQVGMHSWEGLRSKRVVVGD